MTDIFIQYGRYKKIERFCALFLETLELANI